MVDSILPSWRDGAARTAVVDFLDMADQIPPDRRLAAFDNDGTLWCEKPHYPQLDFFVWELRHAVEDRPALGAVPEYEALLKRDTEAMAEMGLERIALALVALFEQQEPEQFEARVNTFFDSTRHPDTGLRYDRMIYQPMLELLQELETRGFTNCIVTGGGTEFVRAISRRVYGIEPERVVGTLVTYTLIGRDGRPVLVRTNRLQGEINEGGNKISNIQIGLGRRPVLAAGNSPGDAAMLEHTSSMDGPSLALLIDHDDGEREYAYRSRAGTFAADEPIETTASRLGWSTVSMGNDWTTVFPS